MTDPVLDTSNRTFTKKILVVNMLLLWISLFYAIHLGAAGPVIAPALSFLVMMFGLYTGVGHMDFRTVASMAERMSGSQGASFNRSTSDESAEEYEPDESEEASK